MNQLRLWKKANSFDISDRTLYRYLNELDILVASKWGEALEVIHIKNNRKHWKISPLSDSDAISSDESLNESPKLASLVFTDFGKSREEKTNHHTRDLVNSAIDAKCRLLMINGEEDPVNLRDALLPLLVIHHKQREHLCFFREKTGKIEVLPLHQLNSLRLLESHFSSSVYDRRMHQYFQEHFGVAPNFDEQVYDIELVFSDTMADQVQPYYWHASQRFETLDVSHFRMTLRCGINEELIQWISQWMPEVQVHQPAMLKNELMERLAKGFEKNAPSSLNRALQIAS